MRLPQQLIIAILSFRGNQLRKRWILNNAILQCSIDFNCSKNDIQWFVIVVRPSRKLFQGLWYFILVIFEDPLSLHEFLIEYAIKFFATLEAHHVSKCLFEVEIWTFDSNFCSWFCKFGNLVNNCVLNEWPKEYQLSYLQYLEKPTDPAKCMFPIIDDPLSLVADAIYLKNES